MTWLRNMILTNGTYLLGFLMLALTFIFGVQIGESRKQRAWNEERQKIAVHQAKQEQHTIDIARAQKDANQEISDEIRRNFQILSDSKPVDVGGGVCNSSSNSGGDLPSLPGRSAGVDGQSTHAVPATSRDEAIVSCDQLVQDAAKTTLMLVEFQRWYSRQSAIQN